MEFMTFTRMIRLARDMGLFPAQVTVTFVSVVKMLNIFYKIILKKNDLHQENIFF